MGWAGSLIGLSSHHRLLSSRRLSGQLRHQKTGVLAYKTLDYVFSFKAFLTYHFLRDVMVCVCFRWPAMCIHGDKQQQEREWVLAGKPSADIHMSELTLLPLNFSRISIGKVSNLDSN